MAQIKRVLVLFASYDSGDCVVALHIVASKLLPSFLHIVEARFREKSTWQISTRKLVKTKVYYYYYLLLNFISGTYARKDKGPENT